MDTIKYGYRPEIYHDTENTFDMGIVFLTKTRLTFAYFISED